MHRSALQAMTRCVETFVPRDRPIRVVDLGSATSEEQVASGMTHGALFREYDAEVIGMDVIERANVDIVLAKPYKLPVKTNSVDIVVSGQVFEHIPFFWATMFEIARILKPGGIFIMTAPSRGHKHMVVDCWRFYDDAIRAMAAFTGLAVRQAHADLPKSRGRRRFPVPEDATDLHYWGDTIGVFEKPLGYPTRRMLLVRGPVTWWANKTAGVFDASVESERRRKRLPAKKPAAKAAPAEPTTVAATE